MLSEPVEKKVDYKEIVKYIKELNEIYPYMSREEKSYFWHILIKKITAEKERFVIEWNGFGTSIIPRKEMNEEGGKTHQVWRRGEDSDFAQGKLSDFARGKLFQDSLIISSFVLYKPFHISI